MGNQWGLRPCPQSGTSPEQGYKFLGSVLTW